MPVWSQSSTSCVQPRAVQVHMALQAVTRTPQSKETPCIQLPDGGGEAAPLLLQDRSGLARFPEAGASASFVCTWRGSCMLTPGGPALLPANLTGAKAPMALGPSPGKPPVGFLPLSSWSSRESKDSPPPPTPLTPTPALGGPGRWPPHWNILRHWSHGASLPKRRISSDVVRR